MKKKVATLIVYTFSRTFQKWQISKALLVNAFQKERVPERVPEIEERSRNAFPIFQKGTRQECNHKNYEERERNACDPQAFLFLIFLALKLNENDNI